LALSLALARPLVVHWVWPGSGPVLDWPAGPPALKLRKWAQDVTRGLQIGAIRGASLSFFVKALLDPVWFSCSPFLCFVSGLGRVWRQPANTLWPLWRLLEMKREGRREKKKGGGRDKRRWLAHADFVPPFTSLLIVAHDPAGVWLGFMRIEQPNRTSYGKYEMERSILDEKTAARRTGKNEDELQRNQQGGGQACKRTVTAHSRNTACENRMRCETETEETGGTTGGR
jgi:hypothetical protein